MADKLDQSVEYYVEKAFKDLLKVVFQGWSYEVALRPFVALDDSSHLPDIIYPAIEFAAEPYVQHEDASGFGEVSITLVARSHSDDDPVGHVCDKIFANAIATIDLAELIVYASSKITIKGLVKVKQTGIALDANSSTREKTVTYSVYLASLQKA